MLKVVCLLKPSLAKFAQQGLPYPQTPLPRGALKAQCCTCWRGQPAQQLALAGQPQLHLCRTGARAEPLGAHIPWLARVPAMGG